MTGSVAATIGKFALGIGAGVATGFAVDRFAAPRRANSEEHRLQTLADKHANSTPAPGEVRGAFPGDPLETDAGEGYARVFPGVLGTFALGGGITGLLGKFPMKHSVLAGAGVMALSGALIGYQIARVRGGNEGRERVDARNGVDIQAHAASLVQAFDANGDGSLRLDPAGNQQTEFLRRYTGDSPWEPDWISIEEPLRAMDADANGLVDPVELRSHFERFDGNDDGIVTRAEKAATKSPDEQALAGDHYIWSQYG